MMRELRGNRLVAVHEDEERRLGELMQDKSVLRLQLMPRSSWVKTSLRMNCGFCVRNFGPFVRKHHCRGCGEVVCKRCNKRRVVAVGAVGTPYSVTVRLCFNCIDRALLQAASLNPVDTCSPSLALELSQCNSVVGEEPDAEDDLKNETSAAVTALIETNHGQKEFDALCELASRALGCTVAAVGFMKPTGQWFKARIGIAQQELPLQVAFCSKLQQETEPTIVLDTTKDERFRLNPLVTGSAHIRFYASAPICDHALNKVVGSVFVMDATPKDATPKRAMEILNYLSTAAERLLVLATPDKQIRRRGHSVPTKTRLRLHSVPEDRVPSNVISMAPPKSLPRKQIYNDPSSQSQSSSSGGAANGNGQLTARSNASAGDLVAQRSVVQLENGALCLDLLSRITNTQQLLFQQQQAIQHTLADHSVRIDSIQQSVLRMEALLVALEMEHKEQRGELPLRRNTSAGLLATLDDAQFATPHQVPVM